MSLTDFLTSLADSIRQKDGTAEPIPAQDMSQRVLDIPSGGGDIDGLIDKSITELRSNAKSVGGYALYQCKSLIRAELPEATAIGTYAFNQCTSLASAEFPLVKTVSDYAFASCTALVSAKLVSATSLSTSTFFNCTALVEAEFPALKTTPSNSFGGCASLAVAKFPMVNAIYSGAFASCTSLGTIELPALNYVDNSAFNGCTSLSMPEITVNGTLGGRAFQNCGFKALKLKGKSPVGVSATAANTQTFARNSKMTHIWISKEHATIHATTDTIQPFYFCPTTLKIYTDAESALPGWGAYWNYSGSTLLETNYGVTEEQFSQIVNNDYGEQIY